MRGLILIGLYASLFVGGTILIPLVAIFGFADCLLRLRERRSGNRPNLPSNPN